MAKSKTLKVVETKREVAKMETETNFFTEYARLAGTAGTIIGMILRFSKGDWIAGQESEPIEEGTKLIANMDSLLIGWQRWEDARPAEQAMGTLASGFKPPRRDELSFNDPSEWEVDESTGKPRDPWVATHMMLMKEPGKRGQMFTFTTNSAGGRKAVAQLCGIYGQESRAEHPDEYPVVELGVDSYLHSVASYGRIKIPVFTVVGWADKSEFEDAADAPVTGSRKKK